MISLAKFEPGLLPSFTVIGLVLGGTFAMVAIGLVLIYRVSGVLNFAHGAVGMFATFVAYQVSVLWRVPSIIGLFLAILTGCVLGYVIERLTMRPLANRSALTRVVVTIGWLLVLQTAAILIWGNTTYHLPVQLVSRNGFRVIGTSVIVGYDQLATLIVAGAIALGTAALLRYTMLGTAMRAVADDPDSARLWGVSSDRVMAASWIAGSAMAAVAGVLVTPLISFTPFSLTLIVIDAFAAALIGRLVSLPWTVVGALLLGLAEEYPHTFSKNSGVGAAASFLLVVVTLSILFRPGFSRRRLV